MRRTAIAAAVQHQNVAAAAAVPPPIPPVVPPPGVAEAAMAAVQVAGTVSQSVRLSLNFETHLLPSKTALVVPRKKLHRLQN